MTKKKTVKQKEISIVLVQRRAAFTYEANPTTTNTGNSIFRVEGLSLVAGKDSLNLAITVTPVSDPAHDPDNYIHFPLAPTETNWDHSPTEHRSLNSVINLTDYYQDITQEVLDKFKETYKNINSPVPVKHHFALIADDGDVHEFEGYSFKRTLFVLI